MAKYLVTGAAGFIGSHLSARLVAEGHEVTTIDNLSTGFKENIPQGVAFIHGDVADREVVRKLDGIKFDAVFHVAGQSSGEISFEDPIYDIRANAESTLLLLKFCAENECSRLIFTSTMSVYGAQPRKAVKEECECRPSSFYGVAKLASENYLRIYSQYGIRSTSLRLFNVYGSGQNLLNLKQGMVSIYLSQMLARGRIEVKGSADRFRDFIHVDDVVEAMLRCVETAAAEDQIINIATGIPTKVKRVIELLIQNHSKDIPVEFVGATPGDLHGIYADVKKMNRLLGEWKKIDLETGIKTMLRDSSG